MVIQWEVPLERAKANQLADYLVDMKEAKMVVSMDKLWDQSLACLSAGMLEYC